MSKIQESFVNEAPGMFSSIFSSNLHYFILSSEETGSGKKGGYRNIDLLHKNFRYVNGHIGK
jgi:hypothetical protein